MKPFNFLPRHPRLASPNGLSELLLTFPRLLPSDN
jgi:hypothetical protein